MTEPTSGKNPEHIRILHTADWHLGREFHGADLTEAHQVFFDWLTVQITEREIDLVIMAGDIFDRALPPVKAIELFNENVDRLAALTRIVLISGNHDSVVRMSYGPLLRNGLHLRSGTEGLGTPLVFDDGPFPLAVYPIPYLDPITTAPRLDALEATHEAVIGQAVLASLEDLKDRPPRTRSVAIGHAFIAGSKEPEVSDSERGIVIGNSEQVPAESLDGFDYVALGHLHRPQQVAAKIRYSGSPLYLSFSEVGAEKSVSVIDLDADGKFDLDAVPVPSDFRVVRLSGTLTDLLENPDYERHLDDWLEIELTDERRPDMPKDQLDRRFNHVLSLRFSTSLQDQPDKEADELDQMAQQDPLKLVSAFIEHVRSEPDEHELKILERALASSTSSDVRS